MTPNDRRQPKRRDVLRATTGGVVSAAGILAVGGTVSADDGTQRLIVEGPGNAKSRIEDEGFGVVRVLAGGDVLFVNGTELDEEELSSSNGVREVVPNFTLELDPGGGRPVVHARWDGNESDGATADSGSDVPELFDRQWGMDRVDVLTAHETTTGDGARVAIVDTGIHPDHVDLVGNVDETDSVAFDEAGERDDDDDEPIDGQGHGTAVAGAIGAHGANAVLGVTPDAELGAGRVNPAHSVDEVR